MLRQQDVVEQRQHYDAVSYGGWSIDLHPADGIFVTGSIVGGACRKPGTDGTEAMKRNGEPSRSRPLTLQIVASTVLADVETAIRSVSPGRYEGFDA